MPWTIPTTSCRPRRFRELEILKVLWEHGPRGVGDVHRLLRTGDGKQPHLNTVQTLLRLMEVKAWS